MKEKKGNKRIVKECEANFSSRIIQPGQVCTVGRLSTCTIVFDEYGVSRIQCK